MSRIYKEFINCEIRKQPIFFKQMKERSEHILYQWTYSDEKWA